MHQLEQVAIYNMKKEILQSIFKKVLYITVFSFILLVRNFSYSLDKSASINYHNFETEDFKNLSTDYDSNSIINGNYTISDPLEFINRPINDFNMITDTVFIEPIVNFYRFLTPNQARMHITNFYNNLNTPITLINDIFQLKFEAAHKAFWRFFINSIWGFGGIADVASEVGIDNHVNSFDQTLGCFMVPDGPFMILPILGPTTARGVAGKAADWHLDILNSYIGNKWSKKTKYLKLLNSRSEKHDIIQTIKYKSIDPYSTLKSLYIQSKIKQNEQNIKNKE